MTYEEAMDFIHCTDWKGSRLGLERMRELMHLLGDPQDELKFIHVAGTNGKGSVCSLLSQIFTAAGYRTGLYTSPHLLRVNERMRIGGTDITDEALVDSAEAVQNACRKMQDAPTEFEIITAMAFWYFAREKCDIVVLETGLGGRLDATNVIKTPEAAVIMNIGLEHTEILGDTLPAIAGEKAGIIKEHGLAVTYPVNGEVDAVYEKVCAEKGAEWHAVSFDTLAAKSVSLDGQCFDYGEYKDLHVRLLGAHQLRNAAMAVETVRALRTKGWNVDDAALRRGLADTRWEARFELLSRDPRFVIDGAHNPQCVQALAEALQSTFPGEKIVFLTGMLADKDYMQMTRTLLPFAREFVTLTPDSPRALSAGQLAEVLRSEGAQATPVETTAEGISLVLEKSEGAPIVACGSLYMMGELRAEFRPIWKKFLRRRAIARRKSIPRETREEYNAAIVERIAQSDEWAKAKTILSYVAVRGEPSLSALEKIAAEQGKTICYPYCTTDTEMIALHPDGESAWRRGRFDIPEPIPERSEVVPTEKIDLVLCPGTSFDEQCHRMGMGAGYYDRYLPKCPNATAVIIAYEIQRLEEAPHEAWDVPMQAVFTEKRTIRR